LKTIDAEENKKRLEEIRKKLLEALDLTVTPEEAERRKKEAIPPEFQDEKEEEFTEEDFQDETETEEDE
jgi:hypothetical protein